MEDWLSKDFIVEFEHNDDIDLSLMIDAKFSDKQSRPSLNLIDQTIYKQLNETKNKIDDTKNWEYISKLCNPYEKITKVSGSFNASRAYFKLYEILMYHSTKYIIDEYKTSFHECEAPGGFIQATIKLYPTIDWKAQTLYTNEIIIDNAIDDKYKWIGKDKLEDPGNLFNNDTIKDIIIKLNNKIDLVTGDGGISTNFDPNNQEQHHLRLIFDTVTKPTVQLITILTKYYNNIYIIKPRTSRFSNSEKYLVCHKFIGIPDFELDILNNVHKKWNNFCRDFCIEVPESISNAINIHNKFIKEGEIAINLSLFNLNSKSSNLFFCQVSSCICVNSRFLVTHFYV